MNCAPDLLISKVGLPISFLSETRYMIGSNLFMHKMNPPQGSSMSQKRDPNKPRRPLNPYQRFFKEERCKLLGLEGENCIYAETEVERRRHRRSHGKISFTDLSKHVSAKWRNMSITEKQKYQDEFKILMKIYKEQKEEYEAKNASQNSASEDETDEMDRNSDSLETQKEIRKRATPLSSLYHRTSPNQVLTRHPVQPIFMDEIQNTTDSKLGHTSRRSFFSNLGDPGSSSVAPITNTVVNVDKFQSYHKYQSYDKLKSSIKDSELQFEGDESIYNQEDQRLNGQQNSLLFLEPNQILSSNLESLEEEISDLFESAPWILECLCSQEEANLSIDDD